MPGSQEYQADYNRRRVKSRLGGTKRRNISRGGRRPRSGRPTVDGDDVQVVEGRGRARLLLEAAQAHSVLRVLGRQELQSDLAAEARVLREINLAPPAPPQRRENFVRAEKLSGV